MYQVTVNGHVHGFFFNRDEAIQEANHLIMEEHVYAKVEFNGGQDVSLIKACTQKSSTAFDTIHATMRKAKSKKTMSPVKIIRGGKEYTVPVAMLGKNGEMKKGVREIVNAYFKRVAQDS